jgi:hypothetical protein
VADVSLGSHNTIYSRTGDWLGWLSLIGFVAFMFLPDALKKRQVAQEKANAAS